ncbi:MAG: 2-phosphosulfolactate phosphatase [Chloroflexi bacterium]|nr:MAG: 2-phosphosulfolactate phosphatase [Chloroflexota bacterium]
MEITIHRIFHETADLGRGVVVVIDVIRAFSVAAYAFAGGASEIWLVRHVEEALALKAHEPSAVLAGEVNGRQILGFDLSNSPAQMAQAEVRDRLIIQRTGSGTRGAVSAINAERLLACSLVNARSTARYAAELAKELESEISLFPTASLPDEFDDPNEDDYCADYLAALLLGSPDAEAVLGVNIEQLRRQGRFELFARGYPDCPPEDVPRVLDVNRFSFAMEGVRRRWNNIDYISLTHVDIPTGITGRQVP